jgi:coenzyme F420-reducing hydrogenase delta subunit
MAEGPRLIVYGCRHTATPLLQEAAGRETRISLPDLEYRELTCLGALDPLMVLRDLDEGAEGVVAVGCLVARCRHLTGSQRAKMGLDRVGDILDEVGVGRHRVGLVMGSPIDPAHIREGIQEFMEGSGGEQG